MSATTPLEGDPAVSGCGLEIIAAISGVSWAAVEIGISIGLALEPTQIGKAALAVRAGYTVAAVTAGIAGVGFAWRCLHT